MHTMHISHEAYIEGCQAEAVQLAKSLLANSIEFLVAIRRLSSLRHEIGTSSLDEDFILFLVIDSDTDHLPAGDTKALCSPDWLQKTEAEVNETKAFHHAELIGACNKIIQRFSARA